MTESLVVNEIYGSVQGESTFAGLPCLFVRLTGCPLRCSYCDTAYAFGEGRRLAGDAVLAEIDRLAAPYAAASPIPGTGIARLPLVELTGGEPLLQKGALALMRELCDRGFTVLLETSGALDIGPVDPRVHRIVDLKCPSSGEEARNRWENLPLLRATDEIKFVVGTREDYAWVKETMARHRLAERCPILVSWVHPLAPQQQSSVLKPVPANHTPLERRELVEALVADALPVRFQAQLHKIVWPPERRGV
ncbi:MAG: radical SAM protein [Verrucomicrobiales bacterium]|nr:radical SAM protein [Verrucomicrobiales bacterium]